MFRLRHIRSQRWPWALIVAAILLVYLAISGTSTMISGWRQPANMPDNPLASSATPLPQPEQLFTTALAPPAAPAEQASVPMPKIGRVVGEYLAQARELAIGKQFREAMELVNRAITVPNKTPAEEYVIREMLAYVALNLGDYATAAQAYEETLGSPFLPADKFPARIETVIKLRYQEKNYGKVQEFGQLYLDKIGYNTEIVLLMAQAHYVQQDYANAAQQISTLIKRSDGRPGEDMLRLLMSCQHNLNQRNEVITTLTTLLQLYPKQGYWLDMFSYLQARRNLSDRAVFEIFRLRQNTIGLATTEHLEMAELAMALGLPGEAETVLQHAFSANLISREDARSARLLALAQTNSAQDRAALTTLEQNSRTASTGYDSIKLGEAYLSYGQYDQAIEAINRGLNKGNFAQVGEAQLHLGIALAKLNQKERARAAFNAVPKNSALRPVAKVWAAHLGKT